MVGPNMNKKTRVHLSKEEDEKYAKYGKWIVVIGTIYIIFILFLFLYKAGII